MAELLKRCAWLTSLRGEARDAELLFFEARLLNDSIVPVDIVTWPTSPCEVCGNTLSSNHECKF